MEIAVQRIARGPRIATMLKGVIASSFVFLAIFSSLGALALLAMANAANAQTRENYVAITGCVRDLEGKPVHDARVELVGTNYNGGYGYAGDEGVTRTERDGSFSILMKKGGPGPAAAKATITVWAQINDGKDRRRVGSFVDVDVENTGSPKSVRAECLKVSLWYWIVGRLIDKDMTPPPRDGSFLTLRFEGKNPDDYEVRKLTRDGRFEFGYWLVAGQPYTVTIDRDPTEENCYFKNGGKSTSGTAIPQPGSPDPRYIMAVEVKCDPAPLPPRFYVHIIVSGKDSTMREGASVGLKLTTKNPAGEYFESTAGSGRVEVTPTFPAGVEFTLTVDRQPTNEICEVQGSGSGETGIKNSVPMGRKQVMEVRVTCAPVPGQILSGLPRRTTGYAALLVQQSISDAEFDERNPGVRVARKRAEVAAQQEAARREAAESAANTAAVMSGLLDLVQGAANIRGARGSDTAAAIAQGLSQRPGAAAYVPPPVTPSRPPAPPPIASGANSQPNAATLAYQAEAARAKEFDRQAAQTMESAARSRAAQESARQQQAAEDAAGRRILQQRADQQNNDIRAMAELNRQRNTEAMEAIKRAQEEARYYPVMQCVQAGDRCHQNNCGRSVVVFWADALTSVSAGYCYPSAWFGKLIGACEIGSSYDSKRGQCKK